MADGQAPPHQTRLIFQLLFLGVVLFSAGKLSAQIQGSAGQEGTKPFTATIALREGYDSNPLTQTYQSSSDVKSSTYSSVQPSLGYNYTGLQADLALRYDFTGTYFPSINQSYDIQYSQAFIGRHTYAFNPRTSLTVSDNFIYSEQPVATLVTAGLAPTVNTQGFINNLGTIQGDYRVTDRLAMITRWNNSILNTDGAASYNNTGGIVSGSASASNYMNNGAFQQFRLDVTPETVATFTFDYQIYDYQSDQNYRDNQQVSLSLGADQTFTPTITFSGRAGIQLNDNYGLSDSSSTISSGGLGSGEVEIGAFPFTAISSTWNYDQKSFVSGGLSIAVQQSNLATSSDSEAYTINANWDHYFTDRLSVIQSIFLNVAVFTPQLTQAQSLAISNSYQGSGQQTTLTYQCKFAYEIFPYLSAELGWSYTNYGSYFDVNNGNGGSYTRNQVYLGVRGTY